ncbi:AraC-like DNA-binding protein [Dyella japonica]|uniref:AraC-like DNA-binding protein n=2 Tax=Dyella japonica TaxID=231455 RepID=A0ABV2K0E3_9GAMM
MMAGEVDVAADVVDADERNVSLRDVVWPIVEMAPFAERDDASLTGSMPARNIGPLSTGVVAFTRQREHRDGHGARRSETGHYLLQLLTTDSLQAGVDEQAPGAGVGDICIFDLSQTPQRQAEAGSMLSMAMPRQALEKAIGSSNLHGVVLKANGAMTPLLASMLRGVSSLGAPLHDSQATAVQEAVVTLLSAALKDDMHGGVDGRSLLGAGLRQRIVEFITHNVHLLELSPDFLCRRFKVSRAHLYRAFASDGGVAKVLRDIRLDAAFRELTGAVRTTRSITEIAYSLGFSSSNQLLRSFRTRFGMTPSAARTNEQG